MKRGAAAAARPPCGRSPACGIAAGTGALLLVLICCCAAIADAQQRGLGYGVRPEVRLDALIARRSALHAGVGASVAPARYLRVSLVAAGGVTVNGEREESGRVDLMGRFVLDPFRQHRIGGYAGAGVGVRGEADDCCRPLLILVAGAEGPHVRGRTVALELGYGGGVRIGVAIRSTPRAVR